LLSDVRKGMLCETYSRYVNVDGLVGGPTYHKIHS